jgi:hypothetical protein
MADENPGVGSGILGMFNAFVDPAGLAKAAKAKLFWLWPVIVVSIVFMVFGYLMEPYSLQLADAKMAQQGIPAERLENAKRIAGIMVQVTPFVVPVFLFGFLALFALLVKVTGSIVGLAAKFRDVFSLMAACSLVSCLQYVATYVVLHAKGDEITNQDQLTPPFGLDIFIPAHGALLAILNFFSIFEIWYLVIFGLALAALTGSSKGKAFAAITPAWLIPLIFKIIGSFFGGNTSN